MRGTRVQGLIRYLYGPGRCEDHRNPRIVAGFRSPGELEPSLLPDGRRDFRRLEGLLNQPVALLGERNYRKPVWHLPVRAAPEDPVLTDAQWAEIAEEIMARTGLARPGDEDAVRWIAVRHADDHIHIVATLARTDGDRPYVWNDAYRVRDACRAVEERFGLRKTAPANRTAAKGTTRAEMEKARRQGKPEPARVVLRRQVQTAAAGARSEVEFFDRLRSAGVLIRTRFSRRDPEQVTGYAVALPDDRNTAGQPIFYSGGKLAADLTLPRLRHRWSAADPDRDPRSADYHPITGRHLSARSARAFLRKIARQAADQARTVEEFLTRLERQGVIVRRRFSQIDPAQVTGYAVTLPDHLDQGGQPIWYRGADLADDLTLPKLQRRWNSLEHGSAEPDLTPEERQAFYDDAARATADATAQLRRHLALGHPHAARDICWATADILHTAAAATGNRHLQRAANSYDRAARLPYGRLPTPTPPGNGLRTAARLLALADLRRNDPIWMAIALLTELIALLDTITELHQTQHREPQTTATRTATGHLQQLAPPTNAPADAPHHPVQAATPVAVAMADFPVPWAPVNPAAHQDRQSIAPSPHRPMSHPHRRNRPSR
ncbi:relaxase/mobilization nuclease domain-containing protein [Thermomonospora cellulosilytica]|uniref:MobA/VirD2-like nuclease domain-containing protein n=1 Tax=Thermomonospora cellulosilytica TaxID=1411118 RepID=A0A7W3R7Z1_9ACTN|nr:relaxase/mobilization nuclease domain-containing protein [Thermomonospora cellulosilytica]MBA9002835.1 hypothetical protein [Thermomonospora cellulosilytica]